ncbi:MAG: hypothetical protein WAN93_06280, partial [Solirubrobacteraceae bacterium]
MERIYFKDDKVAHHQVSVDFTLPRDIEPVSEFEGKDVYIAPLFLLAKESLNPLRVGKLPRRRFIIFGRRLLEPTKLAVPSTPYSNIDFTNQEGHNLPLLTQPQSAQVTEAMLLEEAERLLGRGRVTGQLQDEIS